MAVVAFRMSDAVPRLLALAQQARVAGSRLGDRGPVPIARSAGLLDLPRGDRGSQPATPAVGGIGLDGDPRPRRRPTRLGRAGRDPLQSRGPLARAESWPASSRSENGG